MRALAPVDGGASAPFDPRTAVERFVPILKKYGIRTVIGDKYAGETFLRDFLRGGISYEVATLPASKLFEGIEPLLQRPRVAGQREFPLFGCAQNM